MTDFQGPRQPRDRSYSGADSGWQKNLRKTVLWVETAQGKRNASGSPAWHLQEEKDGESACPLEPILASSLFVLSSCSLVVHPYSAHGVGTNSMWGTTLGVIMI